MLPNDRTRALLDSISPREQAEEDGFGELVTFAPGFLRRQYWVIILTAALVLAASVIYLRITPPVYTAQAKVLYGNPKAQFVQRQSELADAPVDASQIESQIQILTSKAIATSVINQLKLADDPEFKNPGRSWRSIIREWLGGSRPARPIDPMEGVVDDFDKRLSTSRLGHSTVIEIRFSAGSAERSAEIANTIANTYVADQISARLGANRTATAWLHDRLEELGQQALKAERSVGTFKSENNIDTAGGKRLDEEQVTELNTRLVAARTQFS